MYSGCWSIVYCCFYCLWQLRFVFVFNAVLNPLKPNGISLFLSIGPVHFRFKACYAVFFMFIKIVMELSVNTQWIP